MKTRYKKFIPWAIIALIIIVQFIFSAQPGEDSKTVSSVFAERLNALVSPTLKELFTSPDWKIKNTINHFLRKFTHFSMFLLLGFSFPVALRTGIPLMRERKAAPYILSFLILLVVASLDEFHQVFVPERGANLSDVVLDMSGVLTAFLCTALHAAIKKSSAWLQETPETFSDGED